MIRNRFQEICAFLKTKKTTLKFRDDQLDAEIENMTVEDGGHSETVNGFHFANFKYQGVIYVERLPEDSFPMLAILIKAWLDNNDNLRSKYKLKSPDLEVISLGDKLVDVLATIDFVDEVYLAPSASGQVEIDGKKYEVGEYQLFVAESGIVNGGATDV